jgi:hypothetical protein
MMFTESMSNESMCPAKPMSADALCQSPPPTRRSLLPPALKYKERPAALVLERLVEEEPAHIPLKEEPIMPKQAVMVPPVQYHLIKAPVDRVCAHIDHLTKFDLASPAYLVRLKEMMRERHQVKPIVFGYIPAPPNETIVKQVIGANGYFFKMTTTLCDAYFIWHDIESHMFLFWAASTFKIVKAMNSIRWRIVKCYELMNTQQRHDIQQRSEIEERQRRSPAPEPEDEDFYADMPDLVSCGNSPRQISCGSVPDHEHPVQF